MVKHVTGKQLEELLKTTELPVVCDFWANWCGPCRMLAPVFEAVAETFEGVAEFVKVDVDDDDAQEVGIKYGVSAIPNVLVFKNGEKVASHLGFVPQEMFETFVKNSI